MKSCECLTDRCFATSQMEGVNWRLQVKEGKVIVKFGSIDSCQKKEPKTLPEMEKKLCQE